MEAKITYFEKTGAENTDAVLGVVKQRAQELGIKTIVMASTTGESTTSAMEILKGLNIIFVTHVTGFKEADVQQFSPEIRKTIEAGGATVLTTAHAFAGLNRTLRTKYEMPGFGDIIADTLRIFGQGMKVVCEIAAMAADSGLVKTGEEIICVGGSGHGAYTAVVLRPTNSHTFFKLRIREILCKPHL